MKVMCIKNGLWKSKLLGFGTFGPSFGDICTVNSVDGDDYWLNEWPTNEAGTPTTWHKKNFIPLSNIDEMELLEQRQDQLQSL